MNSDNQKRMNFIEKMKDIKSQFATFYEKFILSSKKLSLADIEPIKTVVDVLRRVEHICFINFDNCCTTL